MSAYLSAGLGVVTLAAYVYFAVYRERALPYGNLPGPQRHSFFWGNKRELSSNEPGAKHAEWNSAFGSTYRINMLFGGSQVITSDPTAIAHILNHPDLFPKPSLSRKLLSHLTGHGLLVVEGPDHRRQRRILNPCFSTQAIRDVLHIFYDKAEELRDTLLEAVDGDGEAQAAHARVEKQGRGIDVARCLDLCSVDIIAQAGFDCDLQSLAHPHNDLYEAFKGLLSATHKGSAWDVLEMSVSWATNMPTKKAKMFARNKAVVRSIGLNLIKEKKLAIQQSAHNGGDMKDLLTRCLRANLDPDLRTDQRLSDEEVLAQITTFLLAGTETSSTALSWILYFLTQHPDVQDRVRSECCAVAEERPSLEAIAALPYLDAVVTETLRLVPPIQNTSRQTTDEMMVPLGTPVKGRDGQLMTHVKVAKGTLLSIPISEVNASEAIWGPTARLFDPSRHLQPANQPISNPVPGVWGGQLTFLGGPRSCIGYRFAVAEIKVILFVLVRSLEFAELPNRPRVVKKSILVVRPSVVGEEGAGSQMPLLVKRVGDHV